MNYTGNVVTNFLISFLAIAKDLLFLIEIGASFQILKASFRNVPWLFWVDASRIKLPLAEALVHFDPNFSLIFDFEWCNSQFGKFSWTLLYAD